MASLILLILPLAITASPPTIQLTLKSSELPILKPLLVQGLDLLIANFPIAGISNSNLSLTDNKLVNLTFDPVLSTLTLEEPNILTLNLTSAIANLHYNYSVNFGTEDQRGVGTGQITIEVFTLSIGLSRSASDTLSLSLEHLDMSVSNVTLATDLPQADEQKLNAIIQEDLPAFKKIIAQPVGTLVQIASMALRFMTYSLTLAEANIKVDLHLATEVSVRDNSLSVGFNGQITNMLTSKVYSLPSRPFPESLSPINGGFGLYLSNYTVESLIRSLWNEMEIPVYKLPKSIPLKLTTNGLSFFLPQLQLKYGKGKDVILVLKGIEQPTAGMEGVLELNANITLDFLVDADKLEQGVDLNLNLNALVAALVQNSTATVAVKDVVILGITASNSQIGEVDTSLLPSFFEMLLKALLVPLNSLLVPFPLDSPIPLFPPLGLAVASLVLNDGYLSLGGTLDLTS